MGYVPGSSSRLRSHFMLACSVILVVGVVGMGDGEEWDDDDEETKREEGVPEGRIPAGWGGFVEMRTPPVQVLPLLLLKRGRLTGTPRDMLKKLLELELSTLFLLSYFLATLVHNKLTCKNLLMRTCCLQIIYRAILS